MTDLEEVPQDELASKVSKDEPVPKVPDSTDPAQLTLPFAQVVEAQPAVAHLMAE